MNETARLGNGAERERKRVRRGGGDGNRKRNAAKPRNFVLSFSSLSDTVRLLHPFLAFLLSPPPPLLSTDE